MLSWSDQYPRDHCCEAQRVNQNWVQKHHQPVRLDWRGICDWQENKENCANIRWTHEGHVTYFRNIRWTHEGHVTYFRMAQWSTSSPRLTLATMFAIFGSCEVIYRCNSGMPPAEFLSNNVLSDTYYSTIPDGHRFSAIKVSRLWLLRISYLLRCLNACCSFVICFTNRFLAEMVIRY